VDLVLVSASNDGVGEDGGGDVDGRRVTATVWGAGDDLRGLAVSTTGARGRGG